MNQPRATPLPACGHPLLSFGGRGEGRERSGQVQGFNARILRGNLSRAERVGLRTEEAGMSEKRTVPQHSLLASSISADRLNCGA